MYAINQSIKQNNSHSPKYQQQYQKQDLAKKVSNTLYLELQRSPDEPLSINVLSKHLKQKMGWNSQQIKELHQSMNLASNSNTVDYSDIVQYLSEHKQITQEMQQHFINHPIATMPRIASLSDLRGNQSHSSYFLQQQHDFRPHQNVIQPQLYVYDQTAGIPLSGTTLNNAGGTLYQNPLYHGSQAFASKPPLSLSGILLNFLKFSEVYTADNQQRNI